MKAKLPGMLIGMVMLSGIGFSQGEKPQECTRISPELVNELNHQSQVRLSALNTDREEINGWVSFELTEYTYVHGAEAFYTYGQVISPDSLPRVSFTGGVFRSFTHGFGQLFDPTASDMDITEAQLTHVDAYSIDSIGFPSIYRRVNHNGIDDSLIITVAITDKETSAGNPYDGSFWWNESGLVSGDMFVMAPSYSGSSEDGYHHGLTGTTDAGNNVEIQQYTFALTEDDTEIFWRSFPVDIDAGPDQVVYTFVEFKPSFEATIEDTAFVFDGAEGEANTNSFRTIYDYPISEDIGYFWDLNRDDDFSYNSSYVVEAAVRYSEHNGDDEWRNARLNVYSTWGFRFEYYMNATSSVGLEKEEKQVLQIYPNPSHEEEITINIPKGLVTTGQLLIQDLDGRIILSEQINPTNQIKINPSSYNLARGIYMITLVAEDANYSQRLVIN